MRNDVILVAGLALGFCLLLFVSAHGIRRSEYAQCIKLRQQSEQFATFYATGYESAMCERHGITL